MIAGMQSERANLEMANGLTDVHGPGVIVTVDDATRDLFENEDINNVLVHDSDILIIINDLRRNGAEAISVNGQRIIDKSSISCSGYTIRINGVTYARPFEIRAIGDAKRMASALVSPEGYGTSLKQWGIQFEVAVSDDITIGRYNGSLNIYNYARETKGDEE
jgi:uncharacterized protein YlxW (UPF0749 family)